MMETLRLTEPEQKVFADLFGQCDTECNGKVSGIGAGNLFISSGLSQEVLNQITELCGAKRLGHFGRSQFYVALKLISVAQNGLPVMLESLNSGHELPLPKFGGHPSMNSDTRWRPVYKMQTSLGAEDINLNDSRKMSLQSNQLPPPPKHQRAHSLQRNLSEGHPIIPTAPDHAVISPKQSPTTSPIERQLPDGTAKQQTVLSNQTQGVGPSAANQMHTSHGVPNQMAGMHGGVQHQETDKGGWASFEEDNQGLITEEPKEWAHFTDSSSKQDTSSISSEADSIEDVWVITDEQRDYYINQFKMMQPDVRGVISGAVAKDFFEKSRLPVHELSKIWQLSDVNRDGALSLEEFCTAMHLVVLRRNEIELPDNLPPALIPYVPLNPDEPFAADLPPGSTMKKMSPMEPSPPLNQQQWIGVYHQVAESPTSSSVSSPGSKPTPVNFDYKPIIADSESKIVHPVALRMSPDGHAVPVESSDGSRPAAGYENEGVISPVTGQADFDDATPSSHAPQLPTFMCAPIQGRPRPTPKKAQSIAGPMPEPVSQPILRPPPSSQDQPGERPTTLHVAGGDMAPRPPPRPKSGHSRSNSLDNQLIDFSDHTGARLNQSMPPPAVPPRVGPKDGAGVVFSDGEMIASSGGDNAESATPPGYPKDRPQSRDMLQPYTSTPAKPLVKQVSVENRDFRELIRKQRLKNMALARVGVELNQELQEVMEQRIGLEIQLEHLRPFHS